MLLDAHTLPAFLPSCLLFLPGLPYLDGASFTGYRAEPVPVPGNSTQPKLWFRGIKNLDATLAYALKNLGLDTATEVVVTGTSAGGTLSLPRRPQLPPPPPSLHIPTRTRAHALMDKDCSQSPSFEDCSPPKTFAGNIVPKALPIPPPHTLRARARACVDAQNAQFCMVLCVHVRSRNIPSRGSNC